MIHLRVFRARVRGLFSGGKQEADLQREISSHIDEAAEEFVRQGVPPDDARRRALAQFGGVTQTVEAHRELRRVRVLGSVGQDLRYAVRMLARNPGFTLVAVLTLALGILANTTIFSAVNAVLFRPLAIEKPAELHQIFNGAEREERISGNHTYKTYKSLRELATMFDGVLATWTTTVPLQVPTPESNGFSYVGRVQGEIVSGNYFSLLGVKASQGRLLADEDDRTPNAHPFVVLGERFWRTSLDADSNIVGRLVTLNGHPFHVIGIVPAAFTGTAFGSEMDFWATLMMQGQLGEDPKWFSGAPRPIMIFCDSLPGGKDVCGPPREFGRLRLFVRLPEGMDRAAAESRLNAVASHLAEVSKVGDTRRFTLESEMEARHHDYSKQVRVMSVLALGASILVWLVACGNVANLLLTRANARTRELAIRLSLGAGRWRIARQLLTESGLIALLAGGIAIALTYWTSTALSRALPADRLGDINLDFTPDLRVLGWAVAVSIVTGLVFGTAPAWQSARLNLIAALKPGEGGSPTGARRFTLRNALVVGQLSLSVVVLVAAGLFVRSLWTARASFDPGFRTDRLVSMRISLDSLNYPDARVQKFFQDLVTQARSLPRVDGASLVSDPPFGIVMGSGSVWLDAEGSPQNQDPGLELGSNLIGPRYFQTMGMRMVAGREFDDRDDGKAEQAAIVNAGEARRLFGSAQQAIGKRVVLSGELGKHILRIVGVSADPPNPDTFAPDPRALFLPVYQRSPVAATLVLQGLSAADLRSIAEGVRTIVRQLDPRVPLFDVRLAADHDDPDLARMRLTAQISSVLGLAALAMAMLGLYGVIAYAVTLRRREIGIRMALGAAATNVRALVVRQGLALTGAGLAIGFLGAYLVSPVLNDLLVRMPATDPVTFAGIAVVVTLTALLACYLPARRATRIDPTVTLRSE